jgi:hypothetical protein
MATNTPVYQLRKPADSDNVDQDLDLNDNWDKVEAALIALPQGFLEYAQVTGNYAPGVAGPSDVPGLSVTVNLDANRRIRISAHGNLSSGGTGTTVSWSIREAATIAGASTTSPGPNPGGTGEGVDCSVILTPSAGAHTYKVQIAQAWGPGFPTLIAAGNNPAFILVEDLGAV